MYLYKIFHDSWNEQSFKYYDILAYETVLQQIGVIGTGDTLTKSLWPCESCGQRVEGLGKFGLAASH